MKKFAVVREVGQVAPIRVFKPVFKELLPEAEAKLWAWLQYAVVDCDAKVFVYVEQTPFNTDFKESDDE